MQNNSTPSNTPEKPVWIRMADATRIFGLSRGFLYTLIAQGQIKTACVKQPGAKKGIRLVSYESVAACVENSIEEQGGAK